MAPPPEEVIAIPAGKVLEALALLIWINWFGTEALAPAPREKILEPVEPLAVVTEKFESVAVSARVKEILLLLFVVIVLPPLYAVCSVTVLAAHLVTLFEPSTHRAEPAVPGVVSPFNVRKLVPVVLITTPLAPVGVKVDSALAANAPLAVVVPVTVAAPKTARSLFTVVVPVPAPIPMVVAAPPMLSVVAFVLNTFALVAVVESVPPLTATLPAAVTAPVRVDAPPMVRVPFAETLPVFERVTPVEP